MEAEMVIVALLSLCSSTLIVISFILDCIRVHLKMIRDYIRPNAKQDKTPSRANDIMLF
jgi:hypothetical protein